MVVLFSFPSLFFYSFKIVTVHVILNEQTGKSTEEGQAMDVDDDEGVVEEDMEDEGEDEHAED